MENTWHILVSGRVQGVGFRQYTRKRAEQFGLRGLVRNLIDGRVEVIAIGELANLQTLERVIRKGPPLSRVDQVVITEVQWKENCSGFEATVDGETPWFEN